MAHDTIYLDHGYGRLSAGRVVVGCSGGADSVLLALLLKEQIGPNFLRIVHVNHGLREHANRDEEFVREFCAREGLEFQSVRLTDLAKDEGSLREARLAALKAGAREFKATVIALGHHRDDLAETFLINAMRGAGVRGLGSLRRFHEADGFLFYRPLLDITRGQIREELQQRNAQWTEDETNESPMYLRNRIRMELLPLMEELDSRSPANLAKAAKACADAQELSNAYATAIAEHALLSHTGASALFDPGRLTPFLNALTAREILHALFRRFDPALGPISFPNLLVMEFEKLPESAGFDLKLPMGVLFCEKLCILLRRREADLETELLAHSAAFPIPFGHSWRLIADKTPVIDGPFTAIFDEEALQGEPRLVKGPSPDDVIDLKDGRKTLADCLKEAGAPSVLRKHGVAVYDDRGAVWLPGVRQSFRTLAGVKTQKFTRLRVVAVSREEAGKARQ